MDTPAIPINLLSGPKRLNTVDFFSKYEGPDDEFGFSVDSIRRCDPFFRFFYEDYFRVETLGLENIPAEGRAILVGNHSGVLPIDAFMLCEAIIHHHSAPRRIRFLAHEWLRNTRWLKDVIYGFGGVPASLSVASKLLQNDELVFFYPEGARGTGKPFSMRYRLVEFDPGFVKAAIANNAPIVPITTVGGDEIYPLLGDFPALARLMGTPYWPITLTFPLLPFPVNCIPLPIKMLIKVGKPIHLNYPAEMASDRRLLLQLAKEIQYGIQAELNSLLSARKSPFKGWEMRSLKR